MAETHLGYLKLHVLALHPGAADCPESVGGLNALEAVPLQGSVHSLVIHVAVKLLAAKRYGFCGFFLALMAMLSSFTA